LGWELKFEFEFELARATLSNELTGLLDLRQPNWDWDAYQQRWCADSRV